MSVNQFRTDICESLGYYVYRLVDPRNGETFYVGKGIANRVFEHESETDDITSIAEKEKHKRILEIKADGHEVIRIIHRHFPFETFDKETSELLSFEVESALMDAYTGLTNIQEGRDADNRGSTHISEIIKRYSKEEIVPHHSLMAISIPISIEQKSLYNAVRYAWRVDINKVQNRYVLAHTKGLVRGVFEVSAWLKEGTEEFEIEFKDFLRVEKTAGRYGFIGKELSKDSEISKLYLGKRLPPVKKGAMSPVRYFDKLQSPVK
ncbi:LEM-3-like GIY-YIG domain-containing protein [Candidatus Deianiraea vastatrix]|uniref:GIY-YIG domain-containing protein n=1 Tax=Candidatus Deianiraea vastatrix TaxID=2163644 RepID=A0A5B8XCH5_9RICK|nr:hypothetical protein [Candidatus Deianiraea vastatrix]QED23038.1 hypothetical protein Deia_00230 [Candidatus Deianiraea vastatrix]